MTYDEMKQIVAEKTNRIRKDDMYLQQFNQAKEAYDAIYLDIFDGSQTAGTDLVIFTIGRTTFPVSMLNAEVVSILTEALLDIMQEDVDNLMEV